MAGSPDSWTQQMGGLEALTESGALRIVVVRNGGPAYDAGEAQPADSQLSQAADTIDGTEAFISAGERSVYRADRTDSGGAWSLYLFGTRQEHLDGGLKVVLALAAIGLVFVVFLTILMTNRFLTRFVVRKIEEPLDLLSEGARRLGAGGLDYRISTASMRRANWSPSRGWMYGSPSPENSPAPGRKSPSGAHPISDGPSGWPPPGRPFATPSSRSITSPSALAASTISPPSAPSPANSATPFTPSSKRNDRGSRPRPEIKKCRIIPNNRDRKRFS